MIQFTIGCILLALTFFFGGKDILANNDTMTNLQKTLAREQSKLDRSISTQQRYNQVEENAILSSVNLRANLISLLNIDVDKLEFDFTENQDKTKVLSSNNFKITGYDNFADIFKLVSEIENTKGLELSSVCLNCKVDNEKLVAGYKEVGFKIEGKVYVYSKEQ